MGNLVRTANEWDAPTMLKIYQNYIDTNTCKDTSLPTIAEFVQRIDKYTYGFGWLLSEIDSETAGFCVLSENSYDPTNMFTAEIKLWVKPTLLRRGVGDSLYHMMLGLMELGDKRKVYARINLPNDDAVAFHKHWGFNEVETIKNGFEKGGKTCDVLVMERDLTPSNPEAKKPIKPIIVKLDKSKEFRKLQLAAQERIKPIE